MTSATPPDDSHARCRQATVAQAPVAAPLALAELAEDPVVVMEQEPRCLAPRGHLPDLLLDPSKAWAGRRVKERVDAPMPGDHGGG
jgi:hypothetical protein